MDILPELSGHIEGGFILGRVEAVAEFDKQRVELGASRDGPFLDHGDEMVLRRKAQAQGKKQ